jgi:hypothetical protein
MEFEWGRNIIVKLHELHSLPNFHLSDGVNQRATNLCSTRWKNQKQIKTVDEETIVESAIFTQPLIYCNLEFKWE